MTVTLKVEYTPMDNFFLDRRDYRPNREQFTIRDSGYARLSSHALLNYG